MRPRKNRIINCKQCGKEIIARNNKQLFCNKKCYIQYRVENPVPHKPNPLANSKSTLCWSCKHTNQNECSWFRADAIPVPGWKAIKRPIDGNESYVVLQCPNYEKD